MYKYSSVATTENEAFRQPQAIDASSPINISENARADEMQRSSNAIDRAQRRIRSMRVKICGAVVLLLVGFMLVIMGVDWILSKRKGGVPFILVGLLASIPGFYGVYEIIGTFQGWNGFEESNNLERTDEEDWTVSL